MDMKVPYASRSESCRSILVRSRPEPLPSRLPTRTLCVIRLSAAKGSCRLSAKRLRVGTYRLAATYRGKRELQGFDFGQEETHRHEVMSYCLIGSGLGLAFYDPSTRDDEDDPAKLCHCWAAPNTPIV